VLVGGWCVWGVDLLRRLTSAARLCGGRVRVSIEGGGRGESASPERVWEPDDCGPLTERASDRRSVQVCTIFRGSEAGNVQPAANRSGATRVVDIFFSNVKP
jgi:hypothetical protein